MNIYLQKMTKRNENKKNRKNRMWHFCSVIYKLVTYIHFVVVLFPNSLYFKKQSKSATNDCSAFCCGGYFFL